VPVRAGDQHVERQPVRVDEQVVLAAGLAPVGGVGAGQCTPLFARTLAESRLARDQSSSPRLPSSLSTASCSRSKTPASATRAFAASRSSPARSRARWAAWSSRSRATARTRCPPARPDRTCGAGRCRRARPAWVGSAARPAPHSSPLISRGGGEDTDDHMHPTLRRAVTDRQSPKTHFRNVF
jgi:hypothetical protein